MCFVLEPTFSFLVEKHGAEVGERTHRSLPALVSKHRELTRAVQVRLEKVSQLQQPERDSGESKQHSQKLNDKYFYNTLAHEKQFTDLFYLQEQYFEIQENEFFTSSYNVKGRLAENIEFWRKIGANPENF